MKPWRMQQFLKSAPGSARTQVIAAKLLEQLFGAANDAIAAFDACFRREAFAPLTCDLESSWRRGILV
jgi:hypothetical protein